MRRMVSSGNNKYALPLLCATLCAGLLGICNPAFAQVALGNCVRKPLVIKQPGSYVLRHNLVVGAGHDCIDVTVPNVLIDLNGFSIIGPSSGVGVNAGAIANVTVRNGFVTGMEGGGVDVGENGVVQGVTASSNGSFGISAGANAQILNNNANSNSRAGIFFSASDRVVGNTVDGNGANGIAVLSETSTNALISANTANGNGANGIGCGVNNIVTGNTANSNKTVGIICGTGSTATGNLASLNGNQGILVGDNARVSGNVVNDNGAAGITAGNSVQADGNEANTNASYGLDFAGPDSGYTENVLTDNNGGGGSQVFNGASLGAGNTNLCNGSRC